MLEQNKKELMKKYLIIISLFIIPIFFGCENYIESDVINECFSKNDLDIKFKTLSDSEHQFEIEVLKSENSNYFNPIKIKVENKFKISSGKISVVEGEKYKLRLVLRDNSANPLLFYSFWESSITELRYRTFNGENGNPPQSKTQEFFNETRIFEEIFTINKNENFIIIRLFCEKGEVTINEISIEEMI